MIRCQLHDIVIAETVQTTVATVHRIELALIISQRHKRSSHTLVLIIGLSLRVENTIDGIHPLHDAFIECTDIKA